MNAQIAALCLLLAVLSACNDGSTESRWNYGRSVGFSPTTPSVSPDGSNLVYSTSFTGHGDIYLGSVGAGATVRLTDGPEVDLHPVFSRDAQRVAYAKQERGYQHLWMVDLRTRNQTRITNGRVIDFPLSFSHDKTRLFFIRSTFAGRALLPRNVMFALRLSGPGEGQPEPLGEYSAISPDGSLVAAVNFNRATQQDEIWLMDAHGQNKRLFGYGTAPAFSSDDKKITFLRQDEEHRGHIMVSGIDGTGLRELSAPPGYRTRPEFCIQDSAIIFRIPASERDGRGGIFLAYLRDSNVVRLKEIGVDTH